MMLLSKRYIKDIENEVDTFEKQRDAVRNNLKELNGFFSHNTIKKLDDNIYDYVDNFFEVLKHNFFDSTAISFFKSFHDDSPKIIHIIKLYVILNIKLEGEDYFNEHFNDPFLIFNGIPMTEKLNLMFDKFKSDDLIDEYIEAVETAADEKPRGKALRDKIKKFAGDVAIEMAILANDKYSFSSDLLKTSDDENEFESDDIFGIKTN